MPEKFRRRSTRSDEPRQLGEYTEWFLFALVAAAAFSLPIIPAASLRHFINDQRINEPEKWVIAVGFNFAAAVGLSLIVLLILQFVRQLDSPGEVDVARMALWTLPMAGVLVTFLFATGWPLSRSHGRNRLIDFVLFGCVGILCAAIAIFGQELIAGNLASWLSGQADGQQIAQKVRSLAMVGSASGLLGALHCESSRRGLRR